MNKTIRIAIKSCRELSKKDVYALLREIRYMTCKASNKAMRMYYMWENERREYKNEYNEYPNEKQIYGKTYRNVVEGEMKNIMDIVNTSNISQTNAYIMKKWNNDKKDILALKKSIANFKLNMPIYVKNTNYKISQGNHGYEIVCSFFNKAYQKDSNIKKLTFNIDKLDGNKKTTLNKLISGIYKQGAVQITEDKKGRWYFNISYSFEADKKDLNVNRILGIDVGITNAITMQIWDNDIEEWDRLSWRKCVLDGKELIHFRQKIYARRIELLKNSKIAENNKGKAGHGRKKRIEPIEKMSDKVKDFRDTLNHKYSRYVVDFAIKNNCGIIQMEDLSGFSENVNEKLLKNWSYFDLQNKIKYKAEEKGIILKKINPKYTSKRCSKCGCIHEDNRDCKTNQSKFKCISCGHEENADLNAAKNISLPDIENIIEEQLNN